MSAANKKLSATIIIGGAVAATLHRATGAAKRSLDTIGKSVRDLTRQQDALGRSIDKTVKAGGLVGDMRQKYDLLARRIDHAKAAQDRLNKSIERSEKLQRVGGAMVGAGATATMIGGGIMSGVKPTVKAAINRENVVNLIRNSGVSKEDGDHMIHAAEGARQFGVSTTRATEVVGELRGALGDAHHAIEALPIALKAISGLQMYDRMHHSDMASGDSAYNLAKIAEERGGASSPEAMREKFNWAFKSLTGSNGKVSVAEMLTAVRTGKGAVQAMNDEALFGDTFLQQAMGADRYGTSTSTLVGAWIGGRQKNSAFQHMLDMGLLDKKGVKFDKAGNVNKVSSSALVDAQTFLKDPQKWVDQHLTPLAQKRGVDVNDPAQLMAFVGSITSNPNAANLLLSRMRFRDNIWKDRRNVMMANDAEQSDRANQQSIAGKQEQANARLEDAKTKFGEAITPSYVALLESATKALNGINNFATAHPTVFKDIALGITAVGTAAVVAGPVLLVAGGILQTIAALRLARAAAEVTALTGAMNGVEGPAGKAGKGVLGLAGNLVKAVGITALALEGARALGLPDVDQKKGEQEFRDGKYLAASTHMDAWSFIKASATGGKSLPEVPKPRQGGNNVTYHDNSKQSVTITPPPGATNDAVAKMMAQKMMDMQKNKSKSVMFDQPQGQ